MHFIVLCYMQVACALLNNVNNVQVSDTTKFNSYSAARLKKCLLLILNIIISIYIYQGPYLWQICKLY